MRISEVSLANEPEFSPGNGPRRSASRSSWATPGTVIGDSLIVEGLLGAGGMGWVVLARHRDLGELRAVKLLQPERAHSEEAQRRLVREARAAARIRSPHVVRVFDVVSHGPAAPYVVMEYLQGETLAARLKRQPLSVEQAAAALVQCCEALAEAHHEGTIHRDLKPSNLFLTCVAGRQDFVKVLDFGIAKTIESRTDDWTQSHTLLASPAYASPEQLRASKNVDARADIWSLGAILYESLTGRLPFAGETLADLSSRILRDRPVSIRAHRPELPPEVERIVDRCLEKDPARRFSSVALLVEALSTFAPAAAEECLACIQTVTSAPPLPQSTLAAASGDGTLDESTLTQASVAGRRWGASRTRSPLRRWLGSAAALLAGAGLLALLTGLRRPTVMTIGARAATVPPAAPESARRASVAPLTGPAPAVSAAAAPPVDPRAAKAPTSPRRRQRPARPTAAAGHAPITLEELPLDHLLDERR